MKNILIIIVCLLSFAFGFWFGWIPPRDHAYASDNVTKTKNEVFQNKDEQSKIDDLNSRVQVIEDKLGIK